MVSSQKQEQMTKHESLYFTLIDLQLHKMNQSGRYGKNGGMQIRSEIAQVSTLTCMILPFLFFRWAREWDGWWIFFQVLILPNLFLYLFVVVVAAVVVLIVLFSLPLSDNRCEQARAALGPINRDLEKYKKVNLRSIVLTSLLYIYIYIPWLAYYIFMTRI